MAAKIRKGDKVIVLNGRDKGRTGEVFEVRPTENRALVRGVNMVKRHQKQTPQREGGQQLDLVPRTQHLKRDARGAAGGARDQPGAIDVVRDGIGAGSTQVLLVDDRDALEIGKGPDLVGHDARTVEPAPIERYVVVGVAHQRA